MKKLFLSLLLSTLTALAAHAQNMSYNGSKQDIIIDVRTPIEFAFSHINGAVNIPLERLNEGIRSVQGIHKDSKILLYCRSGSRSEKAREILENQGFRHVQNGGGMNDLGKLLKPCTKQYC
jgi:phage shock protein E